HLGDGARLGRAGRVAVARSALGGTAGLAAVARGGVPAEQLRAGRDVRGGVLGDVLPADLRSDHRREVRGRAAVVRPGDRAGGAASSAFQHQGDVRLRPGQSARVGGYELTYVRPTSAVVAASNGRLERIDLGAQMRVTKHGRFVDTLYTKRSYFPTMDPTLGPI